MNKKKVGIAIGIVIVLIVAAVIIVMVVNGAKRNYEIETISDFKYYTIQKEGKYGVIDVSGKMIIEPTYEAIRIPNPAKPVFVCIYEYDANSGAYQTKVFNEKAEQIWKEYEEVNAIQLKEIVSNVPYEKNVLRIKKDGKYGLMNLDGKVIVEPIYDELDNIAYKEGEMLVKKEDKYGVINNKGTILVDIKYDTINGDNYYSKDKQYRFGGYIVGNKTQEGFRYGYINSKGSLLLKLEYNKINRLTEIQEDKNVYLIAEKSGQAGLYKNKKQLLKNEYQSIEYDELNQIFAIEQNKKYGVANLNGKVVVPVEYDGVSIEGIYIYASKDQETTVYDVEGNRQDQLKYKTVIAAKNGDYHIVIDDKDYYGIETKEGNLVVPTDYLYIEYTFEDYFIACGKDGKLGMINTKNETVIPLKYDVVQKLDDTDLIQTSLLQTGQIELYNKQMQQMVSMVKGKISVKSTYIKVYSDLEAKYFTLDGAEKKNTEIFPDNILFAETKDGKWGFVDRDGKEKVGYTYDKVTEFNLYGYAGIKKDGKWGAIDRNGTVVLQPAYTIDDKIGEPEFIGSYYKVVSGYGETYYTNELKIVQE